MSFALIRRYFVINKNTSIMHVHGMCQQTKSRDIPIRLFESVEDITNFSKKELRLCKICEKAISLQKD